MSGGEGELHQLCLRYGARNDSRPNFAVGMGNPTKYNIEKEDIGKFYSQYCSLVEFNYDDLTLCEFPDGSSPAIFKLLIRFKAGDNFEIPTDDFLTRFVFLSQQVLVQNLQLTDESNALACFILESEPIPSRDGQYMLISYQFHFPYVKCERDFQKNTLRRHLIHRLEGSDIRPYISGAVGNWDEIINKDFYDKPVPMYGSRADPEEPHLEFRKIIRSLRGDELENSSHLEYDLDLWANCNPTSHSFVRRGIISDVNIFKTRMEVDFWLPIILSVHYPYTETLPRRRDSNSPKNAYAPKAKADIAHFGDENDIVVYSKLDAIKGFIEMWKPDRMLKNGPCMQLGEAIYDAMDGAEGGAYVWYTMLEKSIQGTGYCPDFLKPGVKEFCDAKYFTFRLDRITFKTIANYAREDSKEAYEKWHQQWCLKTLEVATNGWDYNVARAFYRCNWLDFLCYYSGKRVIWMVFQSHRHRLVENPNGTILRRILSEQFYALLLGLNRQITDQMMTAENKADLAAPGEEIIRNIANTLRLLRMNGSKNSIMQQAVEFFVHPEFENLKDADPELLGMPNGVLVATKYGCEIRSGMLEDYLTRTIQVPYRNDFSWDHPHVKEILTWMEQMFPDPEMLHYFKKMLSSILRGGNNDKKLFAFTGAKGNNAKTTWVRAMEAVLGGYCVKTPIALLTRGPGEANGPSPATARLEGTRLNCFEEAEQNIPLREGTMKHMTGNDRMYARGLKKSGKDIELMCKTWFVTNVMPTVRGGGGNALKLRFVNIPCDTIWSDNPPDTEEEQWKQRHFKVDRFFDTKLKDLAPALFWIMVSYYNTYIKEGLSVTPQVSVEATERYWEENDQYYQFIADRVEKVYVDVTDAEGVTTRVLDDRVNTDVETLHGEYSNWYRINFPASRIPDRPTFRKEMLNRLPAFHNGAWLHIRVKKFVPKVNNNLFSNNFHASMMDVSMMGPGPAAESSVNMAFNRSIMAT